MPIKDPQIPIGILKKALAEAEKSNAPNFRMAAIAYKGKRELSKGRNFYKKTDPASTNPFKTIHAEHHCLCNCPDLKNATILVIRINKRGKLGTSKPCISCMKLLEDSGARDVIFISSAGEFEKKPLK
jgi:deoxycytidylate deaminase